MIRRSAQIARPAAIGAAATVLVALGGCSSLLHQRGRVADVLLRGGTVYDGSGGPARTADVVIRGDRILHVGPDAAASFTATRTIDATGKIVAPGFIDPHTHPDTYIRSEHASERRNAPWLMQGVATLAIGVDGSGSPEVAEERARFEERGVGTNLALYVGFGRVRQSVLGQEARAPDARELERMRQQVAKAMCEGAFGLSTGLFYPPQAFASTDEVVALAREAAVRGGIYDTHQRDESSYSIGLMRSTHEAIEVGQRAGLPVHLAHLKALGVDVHGKAAELVSIVEAARAQGLRVTADQYPWLASGSNLEASLLPSWSLDGGRAVLLGRLEDAATVEKIRNAMRENLRRRGGAESLLLNAPARPWTGKTLAQAAAEWQLDPTDAALRIIRSDDRADAPGRASTVASFNMREDDLKRLMRQPWVVTSSDGSDGHPRQYASFPEKYARYVKHEQVLTVAQFIRRSTGLTADILGIEQRGYLQSGYFADVVVLDPQRYRPRADYLSPRVLSEGVVQLWVNGVLAVEDGEMTRALAGRVLAHTPTAGSCP